MAKEINVEEILEKIAESKKRYSFPVYIPSLNKDVSFYQMTTSQQKDFIKASMTNKDSYSNTMYALFAVIQQNCADKEIDISKFTILDKLIIALAIRMISISPIYKVVINDIRTDDDKPVGASIDLEKLTSNILKKFKNVNYNETITDKNSDISVVIDLPTIGDELIIEKDIENKLRVEAQSEDQSISSNAVGDLYMIEVIKYVKNIMIKAENGNDSIINLEKLGTQEKIKIFETLPTTISSKVINRINEIVKAMNSISMLELTSKGKKHTYTIDLTSADFFIGS